MAPIKSLLFTCFIVNVGRATIKQVESFAPSSQMLKRVIPHDDAANIYSQQHQHQHQHQLVMSSTSLSMATEKNNDNEETKDTDKDISSSPDSSSSKRNKLKTTIQTSYKKTLTKFINFLPTFRVALSSFTIGVVLSLTLIFVPVYNSVDKMSEPVTLFETILTDLDQGYVDTVDTKKLFETGVNAMLNSLDPYTEFEGRQEAQDMNEGISGKYAGVGLVITGASIPQEKLDQMNVNVNDNNHNNEKQQQPARDGSHNKLLPQDALDDNAKFINNDIGSSSSSSSSNSNSGSILNDEEDLIMDGSFDDDDNLETRADLLKQRMEEKRATKKAFDKGIRVVSAFEGYAFDAGMRPGDKIVAVDGWRINPGTQVEAVRERLRGEPGTSVDITIERDGLNGETTLAIPRNIVRVRDVKLTTFVGKPQEGIGYIQLAGFTANAGNEMRQSIFALQQAAEDASNGEHSLKVSG